MIYLLLANSMLLLCYALYVAFFKRLTFFQLNRCYLLGAVMLSLLIPVGLFIDISSHSFLEEKLPTFDLRSTLLDEIVLGEQDAKTMSVHTVLQWGYLAGVMLAGSWLCFRFLRVLRMIRSEQRTFSFAFFRQVVLGEDVRDNRSVIRHEQVHVDQGHSFDLLFIELVRTFNWFNPVLHLYLKELKFQHECIADELSAQDKVVYAKLLVAQAMQVEDIQFLHEFSQQSFLKNRITMLFKDKSKSKYKLLYLSIAPVAVLTALSTLVFNTSKARSLVYNIENTTLQDLKNINPTVNGMQGLSNLSEQVTTDKERLSSKAFLMQASPNLTENQQDSVPKLASKKQDDSKIFTAVDVNPEPVGGYAVFRKWVSDNYVYPQEAIDAGLKGQIVISFVVEDDGHLSEFEVKKDLGYGMGQAAIDLLKTAANWRPGIQNGKRVRVAYTLPIALDLTSKKEQTR